MILRLGKNLHMGVSQILDLVRQLPNNEQLAIAEAILHSLLTQEKGNSSSYEPDAKLAIAAEALFEDYAKDEELTIFTQLDGEAFHEEW